MILLSITWWQVLLGFFIMHLFAGILLAIAAILPHLGEETTFPLPDKDGKIDHNWATHHIETTTDYSRTSLLANWFLGGLNAHTIHHLFPGICHIHYIPLTEILKETAAEFNVDYKETTLWGAIKSHIRFLKKLGATGYKHGQLVLESK